MITRSVLPLALVCAAATASAQAPRSSPPLPQLPQSLFTAEQRIRVVPVATGLSHPWSLAFLPDGSMLVTEREGRLRIIRQGVLDPTPVAGVPRVRAAVLGGLLDVVLHPRFADNQLLYLTYSKTGENNLTTTALARARFDGASLRDVQEIFVANTWSKSSTNYGGRVAFGRDGMLYLTVGERQEQDRAQDGKDHGGKVLRLRDDGTVPQDNPFVGKPGFEPEIYSLGHRSPQGLAVHPETGALWENEHGPLGGDEINIVLPGRNYGWPLVTFGTGYEGEKISDATSRPDLEAPFMYWIPSIAISGLTFYTGDRFPAWKGNAFVGAMFEGRTRGTGHLQRITFNQGRPIQREPLLTELRQRIRDVRQGPDGLLYVITDEDNGALLRIEPEAQLAAPNTAGVAMGHLHYSVRDVDANRTFWTTLGGAPVSIGAEQAIRFQDVLVFLSQGEPAGGTDGSVVNHVAFRVPSLAAIEAAGLTVQRLQGFPGVASVMTPEGERIELFENAATNLTFTADDGGSHPVAERHNRPLAVPIAFHHIHLYVPEGAVDEAKAWYVRTFGGVPGKRSNYDAVDLPGVNLNLSVRPRPAVGTKGRMLDHIGFEVRNLQAFSGRLEGMGVTLDEPYAKDAAGIGRAALTDPWGTRIELTEGLREY
jgi:glucose/arabinose dehydrogenase/extradiol dioxygenase family protein